MKKKKKFDAVKHVKSLSRSLIKVPQSRPIQSKRKKLLEKIIDRESRN